MSDQLNDRLNAILPRITAAEFLSGSGIGNEIAFHIFDYAPEYELQVREYIRFLIEHLPRHRSGIRVRHLNLFDLVIQHLKSRSLLDRCLKMQREKGDQQLLHSLTPVLDASKVAEFFTAAADPDNHDLILVSGVGSAFPLLRSHTLLNNLHSKLGKTPLVLFYPGTYDGKYLRLFGKLKSAPYYRAFPLVS